MDKYLGVVLLDPMVILNLGFLKILLIYLKKIVNIVNVVDHNTFVFK